MLIVVGTLVGRTLGRRLRTYYCSDLACNVQLERKAPECPGCGGRIEDSGAETGRLAAG